jgi:uncharacterized protein (DUF433 family)
MSVWGVGVVIGYNGNAMITGTEYPHIELDDDGRARIRGTGFKVVQIARAHLADICAEEIQRRHPHLTLSQVYSALAYYYDHKNQIEEIIAEQDRFVEEFRKQHPEPPVVDRLRKVMKERSAG